MSLSFDPDGLTLPRGHFIGGAYVADAEALIRKFGDDSHSSMDMSELQEFFDTYGKDGRLTLEQLARGLGEDPETLRAAFMEADMQSDGYLDMSEFVFFVNG